MKKALQSLILLIAALLPLSASADYVQLADGVYRDGSTLYITSGVTALGPLQVNPSVVYSFAAVPPACVNNTFTGYGATLHMPATSYGAYFVADYWCNFANMYNDAVEPTGVTISKTEAQVEIGKQLSLNASVTPSNATPSTVRWSTTDAAVATVSNGVVTANGVGECDIVATCIDKWAVCHVKVVETTIVITLDMHEARLLPNHSLTITPSMSPISTTLKVTVSNPEVAAARLMNGVVQVVGLAEGSTMIVVSSIDGQAVPDACMVTVYTEIGDVNCDGYVNISDVTDLIDYLLSGDGNGVSLTNAISDVTDLIDYLLSGDGNGVSLTNADCDKDGGVNIADVTTLIDYLLGGIDLNPPVTETFTVNGVTFKMLAVEGGTFTMGATAEQGSDAGYWENPAHQVTLSSYCIGETEVTQALWQAVMGSNPSYFAGDLNRPVEQVSWNDCQTFINKLNELTGKTFRLPTEAEWEYAARGGKRSQGYKYAGSNTIGEVAWYWDNIPPQIGGTEGFGTQTVATKAPNELGLYDMSGNVWEWCQDWYGGYSSESQTNPTGSVYSSAGCVARGGCWVSSAEDCRVSCRGCFSPTYAVYNLGLRLAL